MVILHLGAITIKKAHHQEPEETPGRDGYVISHTGFPYQDYTPNINSLLIIKDLHSQQTIQIKFLIFDLYPSGGKSCKYDYLEVSRSVKGTRKFCSEPSQKPFLQQWYNFTVSGSTMEIKFKTNDRSTVGKGFYFEYRGKSTVSTHFRHAFNSCLRTIPILACLTNAMFGRQPISLFGVKFCKFSNYVYPLCDHLRNKLFVAGGSTHQIVLLHD